MPPVQSQDSLGLCYSYSAGALLDAANCKTGKKDCRSLSPKESFSRLDLAKYGNEVPDDYQSRSQYKSGIADGGSAINILNNIIHRDALTVNEDCASLDKTLSSFGDNEKLWEAQEKAWAKLKSTYSTYKSKEKVCATCATDFFATAVDDIRQDFNLKASNTEILKAFSQDSYERFLDQMMIPPSCVKKANMVNLIGNDHLDLQVFPEVNGGFSNYDIFVQKIKEVLSGQTPVLLEGLCLESNFNLANKQQLIKNNLEKARKSKSVAPSQGTCTAGHSVVITGYRKICKKNNPTDCRIALKVHNSWGQGWQQANNDGWVDGKTLLDRTSYQEQSLAWLKDTKPQARHQKEKKLFAIVQ